MEYEIRSNVIPLSHKGCFVPVGLSEMSDSEPPSVVRGGKSNLAGSLSPQNNTRKDGKDCAGNFFFSRI